MSDPMSSKAGLQFPVARTGRNISAKLEDLRREDRRHASRVRVSAPVYLAAVLECLCAEILELAGNAARGSTQAGGAPQGAPPAITPRHIEFAIRNDEELDKFLGGVSITNLGPVDRPFSAVNSPLLSEVAAAVEVTGNGRPILLRRQAGSVSSVATLT